MHPSLANTASQRAKIQCERNDNPRAKNERKSLTKSFTNYIGNRFCHSYAFLAPLSWWERRKAISASKQCAELFVVTLRPNIFVALNAWRLGRTACTSLLFYLLSVLIVWFVKFQNFANWHTFARKRLAFVALQNGQKIQNLMKVLKLVIAHFRKYFFTCPQSNGHVCIDSKSRLIRHNYCAFV